MKWFKNSHYLTTLGAIFIGFLLIMLLKSPASGGQTEAASAVMLVQLELENQQLANDNERMQQELTKYYEGQSAYALAQEQLFKAQLSAGVLSVRAPGLRITLNDSKDPVTEPNDVAKYVIHEAYLREIINCLWSSGAEAVAVNRLRVTSNTEIFCSGAFIQINGSRQMPPYVIEAVGNTDEMQTALNFLYYWTELGSYSQRYGITREVEFKDEITIPAASLRQYRYIEPGKE
ncbi:MAG: DUF881 domain-containing protein [Peptococcaceae bacterium]|jgi:uncharacterized protein YlxW (UPF0749 family)|nr:DUF881 domain-containing protein [Peptococcaceae bacterium]